MVQIIEENKKPTFGQKLGVGLGRGLETAQKLYSDYQAKEQLQNKRKQLSSLTGMDLASLGEQDLSKVLESYMQQQNQLAAEKLKGENALERETLKGENALKRETIKNKRSTKEDSKKQETEVGLQGALDTVNQMRNLRKKGRLGVGSGFLGLFNPETRKESGEYEQLGKSLIQYATNIPIRNKLEFETLAEELYDPRLSDARAEGVLNAMERIITNSMSQIETENPEERPKKKKTIPKEKPPLTSFER